MFLRCPILVWYNIPVLGICSWVVLSLFNIHSCLGEMFLGCPILVRYIIPVLGICSWVVLSFFDSNIAILCGKERSEDIKGVIRSRNSKKNKQYKDKRHQDKQWPASRLTEGKNWTTRIPLTHESELRCSENRFNNQRLTGIYIFSLGSEIVCRKISKF